MCLVGEKVGLEFSCDNGKACYHIDNERNGCKVEIVICVEEVDCPISVSDMFKVVVVIFWVFAGLSRHLITRWR